MEKLNKHWCVSKHRKDTQCLSYQSFYPLHVSSTITFLYKDTKKSKCFKATGPLTLSIFPKG